MKRKRLRKDVWRKLLQMGSAFQMVPRDAGAGYILPLAFWAKRRGIAGLFLPKAHRPAPCIMVGFLPEAKEWGRGRFGWAFGRNDDPFGK